MEEVKGRGKTTGKNVFSPLSGVEIFRNIKILSCRRRALRIRGIVLVIVIRRQKDSRRRPSSYLQVVLSGSFRLYTDLSGCDKHPELLREASRWRRFHASPCRNH